MWLGAAECERKGDGSKFSGSSCAIEMRVTFLVQEYVAVIVVEREIPVRCIPSCLLYVT